jgi:argininosuccinate lyase
MTMKMWSGRFREPLDPEFEQWQRSFPYDRRLLPFELRASRAHASALERAGVLTEEERTKIHTGLEEVGKLEPNDREAEDVHHFVEKQLASQIGDTAYKLHTGRSRNEQIATDLRLFVRASIDRLQNRLADWIDTIVSRADAAGQAAMPAYTHLQPAEPSGSTQLLAYAEMFSGRDAPSDYRKRSKPLPAGIGRVAGATLTLNRRATSKTWASTTSP